MKKVSIIILTYNSQQYIRLLLDSIKNQSFKDYEIIVVDNASSDGTVEFIKNNYLEVRVIKNPENYWFSKGNNIGIKQAKGEYVLICNHDVKLDENCLEFLVKKLEKDNKIGAVTGKVYKLTSGHDSGILDGVGLKRTFYRKFINIGENREDNGQFEQGKQIFGVSGALFLAKKQALESVKYQNEYFDEDFIAYKEDIDLSYRLNSKGWKIYYEPKAIAWHKRSIQKNSLQKRRLQHPLINAYSYRNHWWAVIKNESIFNLLIFGIFIAVYEFIKFIYILLFEFNSLKFCLKSLKDLNRILQKRKRVQSQ